MATHLETGATRRYERLAHLGAHKVAKGMTDPRGWKVVDAHGQMVGVVKDLIIDTDRMVAAFLDVELDTKFFTLRGDPHVFVPMPRAHRAGDEKRVSVPELTRSRVASLLMARDENQIAFWNRWWQSDAAIEEPGEPMPQRHSTVMAAPPVYNDEPGYRDERPVYIDEHSDRDERTVYRDEPGYRDERLPTDDFRTR